MRILFFIERLSAGGKERRLVQLILSLRQKPDIDMELVVANKDVHYKEILDTDIKVHFLVRKYTKKDPTLFYRFFTVAQRFRPDVIHVWGSMVAFYALPAKLILRISLVNSQIADAPLHARRKWLGKWFTFRFSDIIVANSYAGLRAYEIPDNKGIVIHNGFDFGRLATLRSPDDVKRHLGIHTRFVVGMVASFTVRKDYESYLQAAMTLLDQRRDITFICVGEGTPPQQKITDQYKSYIRVLGRLSDIESLMNICDIGVLTTNLEAHGEGISNALMEFMALGKPVIGTDGGGTPELIHNEVNGLLVPHKDAADLTSKIQYLLQNVSLCDEMGRRGRETVERDFNLQSMTDRFLKVYTDLVRSGTD